LYNAVYTQTRVNYQVKQEVENQEIGISKHDGAQDQFCYIIPGAATFHAEKVQTLIS